MAKNCCYGCVPPKRYPGCHDHCPERKEQLEQREAEGESRRKERRTDLNIKSQKYDGVRRAMRRHGRKL